jgi:phosphomevalonate kinase
MQTCDAKATLGRRRSTNIPAESRGLVALQLHWRGSPPEECVQEIGDSVRDRIERVLTSYEEMDRRFTAAGGLASLLNLYEQVRRELERVSFEELDRMTQEIKTVIEALLKMDYELRKVHNLKLAFEARTPGAGSLG